MSVGVGITVGPVGTSVGEDVSIGFAPVLSVGAGVGVSDVIVGVGVGVGVGNGTGV